MNFMPIDGGAAFDFGRTAAEYARYRDIYPPEFYRRILGLGLCAAGQDCLDLGTGTGVLPRSLYPHGARWTGADVSPAQIAQAVRLAAEAGQDIRFLTAAAEDTGLPDGAFDTVTACQCFAYFDKARAIPEILRLLRPGGHFLALTMFWLPGESAVAAATERLVLQYSPSWTGEGYTRGSVTEHTPPGWVAERFAKAAKIGFDVDVPFTRERWHGRVRTCRGVGASLDPPSLAAFDREHRALLEQLAPERFTVRHRAEIWDFTRAENA